MSYTFEKHKSELIDSIIALMSQKLTTPNREMITAFVQRFYGTVAYDDLKQHTVSDLYGAAISLWQFISERKPNEIKVRVYNPDYETNAWQTHHTIIEIVTLDMPFLVDSTLMELNRLDITSHLIMHTGGIHVTRNDQNKIVEFQTGKQTNPKTKNQHDEAVIYVEIDKQTQPAVLEDLTKNLMRVLNDVSLAVSDWEQIRNKVQESIQNLKENVKAKSNKELTESVDFLDWIIDNHFTFLACRDFDIVTEKNETVLKVVENSELGVLKGQHTSSTKHLTHMTPDAQVLTLSPDTFVIISKSTTIATVHRRIYSDYLVIKRFDSKGQLIGLRHIIGLFTSIAYNTHPKQIPFLRQKVAAVLEASNMGPRSHAGKTLLNILETLPRDDLFQAPVPELLDLVLGIFYIQERRRIRMFARRDIYGRFISCLVYVPRDRFNTELRQAMQNILEKEFHAIESAFTTRFSDSVLARIHYVLRIDSTDAVNYNLKDIEEKIIAAGRSWGDDLSEILCEFFGEEQGNRLINRYLNAFSPYYRETVAPRAALYDIKRIENLSESNQLELNLYKPVDASNGDLHFKLYNYENVIPLSDALPILENMGMRVLSEQPYTLKLSGGETIWINDFGMAANRQLVSDIEQLKEYFQELFACVWSARAENDGFNQLVIAAGLNWRQITVLRAYARYFKQTGFTFSQNYIEQALVNNAVITKNLIELFEMSFDPERAVENAPAIAELTEVILKQFDLVASLDEDRILRRYLILIQATLRTNYFQRENDGSHKPTFSIKLNPSNIPDIPLPKPMYEIFVYSPRVEGVHLRGAPVARGGLRWSDRREDFRTEILGLMKAQQVKNAVIVPMGAKGGFVPKCMPVNATREQILEEGIACYKLFVSSLLSITDNLVGADVVPPPKVYRRDGDDPYLVVAADKGTATFSDIANAISAEYGFWLGDAFASGGSAGYDHKKMGITARGAWESVKRHFRELGINIQKTDFTCIGIGDMSGDVFGNGMLLSKHIKLIAAFDHRQIFFDPNPDPEVSFKERKRLFELPRSAWSDYDVNLISEGGGVFQRSSKSIQLTPQMQAVLSVTDQVMTPNDLIRAILKGPFDLLWNGGIGTFVKASSETHMDVGDRTNDAIRLNANELKVRVIGEGGNLGFTQLARIEFSNSGGLIYTDFIDNSGGVDCSDHEVNIKILFNDIIKAGDLTIKQRDQLLVEMTDDVAALVLKHNYRQSQAISLAAVQAMTNIELHSRYIEELEQAGSIDRALEFLPNKNLLEEYKNLGKGLSRPALAVLLSYAKTTLKQQLLQSDLPEDPHLGELLRQAFPKRLREMYSKQMYKHRLHREIIATQLANNMVNQMGITYVFRIFDETGASSPTIIRAYIISSTVFNLEQLWSDIESLDNKVPAQKQFALMMQLTRLVRRSTRWLLKNRRMRLDIETTIEEFSAGLQDLVINLESALDGDDLAIFKQRLQEYESLGLSATTARFLASSTALMTAYDIIDIANSEKTSVANVSKVYFAIDKKLDLGWIRAQIIASPVESHWDALTRESLRDDLDAQQRHLTISILKHATKHDDFAEQIEQWMTQYHIFIERWHKMLASLRSVSVMHFNMYFVAIRELLDLTQTSLQVVKEPSMSNDEKAVQVRKKKTVVSVKR